MSAGSARFVRNVSETRWGTADAAFDRREWPEREANAATNSTVSSAIEASMDSGICIGGAKQRLMVSILKKTQKRNKKAGGSEQAIRLVLIIVWAIVIVVLGFYGGLHLSHHH
jgi:hypothetical protein